MSDSWRWATVTATSPLRIRLDGQDVAQDVTPDTLVAGLTVGARVWVHLSGRALIIMGAAKDAPWDTDWTDIPITDTANFALYTPGDPIRAIRRGPIVEVQGVVTCTTSGWIDTVTNRTFANLPPRFRPSGRDRYSRQVASGTNDWAFWVATDGSLAAARHGPSAAPAGVWLPFSTTYMGLEGVI